MSIILDIDIPKNCHACDACGISDVVGIGCPCEEDNSKYRFDGRPKDCPLKEIAHEQK